MTVQQDIRDQSYIRQWVWRYCRVCGKRICRTISGYQTGAKVEIKCSKTGCKAINIISV